jgi:RNA polymerase sigma factor (sigma-70 family)
MSYEELVTNNLKLAYKIALKYYYKFKTTIDLEELQSLSYLGLVKAAKSFKADKNFAFSTYAYKSMRNEIITYFNKVKNQNTISLYSEFGEDLTLEDTLSSSINLEYETEYNLKIEKLYKFIHGLDNNEQIIILYYLQGMTFEKIGNKLGLSRSQICVKYRKAINKLRYKFLKDGAEFE